MKKIILASILAVALAFGASAQAATTTVVTYKGGIVTANEFKTFEGVNKLFNPYYDQIVAADKTYRSKMAKQLVALKRLASKMSKAQAAKYTKQAKNELKSIREDAIKSLGSKAEYTKLLTQYGIVEGDIQTYLMRSDYATATFRAKITNKARKAQYNKMKKDNQFVVASVRHILIMTTDPSTNKVVHTDAAAKALATKYRNQILKGTDFATLAKQVSEDPGSKDNGGLYADADVNSWVPEFKNAAIKQKLNVVGPLVKTTYGYHIIRVEKRTNKALSEVKSTVDGELVQQSLQTYIDKTITKLIKNITIPN